jgi:amino acid efflux transporter
MRTPAHDGADVSGPARSNGSVVRRPAGIGVTRGAALYVGALMGPGVLLVPALATQAAGPAVIIAWGVLLALSVPLAVTFAALGTRHPVAGGVSSYVRVAFGHDAAAVTGCCFLTATVFGAPAVALIGGFYVADFAGGGTPVAVAVAVAMLVAVLAVNAVGVRLSSGLQLAMSGLLVAVIAIAVVVAVPSRIGDHWTPFAPHGWAGVGTATSILMWLFIGWESMAQFAGDFRDPARQLPRAVALAYTVIAVLYIGLAVATVTVAARPDSKVPLADLLAAGLGDTGRDATAALAVVLTMGTMNVYLGGAARLAASLAQEGALPAWVAGRPGRRSRPGRPLLLLGGIGALVLAALAANALQADDLVRATSACFVAVYLLALSAAVRLLAGALRPLAAIALAVTTVIAGFSAGFLALPALAAALALTLPRLRRRTPPRPRRPRRAQTLAAVDVLPPSARGEAPPPPADHPFDDDTGRSSRVGSIPSPRIRLEQTAAVSDNERPPEAASRPCRRRARRDRAGAEESAELLARLGSGPIHRWLSNAADPQRERHAQILSLEACG